MRGSVLIYLLLIVGCLIHVDARRNRREKSYYEILSLERDSSPRDIKKAYFKLARELHPDKAPADQKEKANRIFMDISRAYEILSDPKTRERYDYLLTQGKTVYDDTPDNSHLYDEDDASPPENQEDLKDSYKTYDDFVNNLKNDKDYAYVTDESTSNAMYFLSTGVVLLIIGLLTLSYFNKNKLEPEEGQLPAKKAKKDKVHNLVKNIKSAQNKQRQFEEELNRIEKEILQKLEEEEAAAIAAEEVEEEEVEEEEVSPAQSDEVLENNEVDYLYPKKQKKKGGENTEVFTCRPCKKSFKSQKQLDNHNSSKKHLAKIGSQRKKGSSSKPVVQIARDTKEDDEDDEDDEDESPGQIPHSESSGGVVEKKQDTQLKDRVSQTESNEEEEAISLYQIPQSESYGDELVDESELNPRAKRQKKNKNKRR